MYLFIMLLIILLDRASKILITNIGSFNVINNFFNITLTHNTGAAWSLLNGYRLFLIVIAIIEIFLIYNIFIKGKKLNKLDNVVFGMLLGGIVGNLLDRIIYGYVIDFLDFNIFGYDFPIFNLADIMIVISIGILLYLVARGEK